MQEKSQPKRFEQVIELIIEKCREMIDSNDIFVEGDKDVFLKNFVEPYLRSDNLKAMKETNSLKSNDSRTIQEKTAPNEGQIEVFHNFPKIK